jgi:hypothetical protein
MKASWIALFGSVLYATLRYNLFQGVPWADWPVYTLNKAFALSALILLVFFIIRRAREQGPGKVRTLYGAGVFGAIHVILSLALLSPAYYGKLFSEGKLTATAGWSVGLGAVAAAAMAFGTIIRGDQDMGRGLRNLSILALVIGFHALLQGFAGWFVPSNWPGMMPPITLISFLLGLAAAAIAYAQSCRRNKNTGIR